MHKNRHFLWKWRHFCLNTWNWTTSDPIRMNYMTTELYQYCSESSQVADAYQINLLIHTSKNDKFLTVSDCTATASLNRRYLFEISFFENKFWLQAIWHHNNSINISCDRRKSKFSACNSTCFQMETFRILCWVSVRHEYCLHIRIQHGRRGVTIIVVITVTVTFIAFSLYYSGLLWNMIFMSLFFISML